MFKSYPYNFIKKSPLSQLVFSSNEMFYNAINITIFIKLRAVNALR